jgi:hypothetical protein
MSAAVLASVLVRGRTEINITWPHRDHTSDGWIGDTAHGASGAPENGGSDHNPNRRSVVDAIDIDVDGINCPVLVSILIRHPSVNYVIWNRRIWSRSRGFVSHDYNGVDPHTSHIHVSIIQSAVAENSTAPWGIYTGTVVIVPAVHPTPAGAGGGGPVEATWAQRLAAKMPTVRRSATATSSGRKAQALLNVALGSSLRVDGVVGDKTIAAAQEFQRSHGLNPDGVVGPLTWAALLGPMPTVSLGNGAAPTVRRVQALANQQGYGLRVDGDFGKQTDSAVRQLQKHFGLVVDGVVGPVTWAVLVTR